MADEAVRRWLREQGLNEPEGEIDDLLIELYLAKDTAGGRSRARPEPRSEDAPKVIDLREQLAAEAGKAVFPDPCPECDGVGYLDRIYLEQKLKAQHCRSCGHRWLSDVNPARY